MSAHDAERDPWLQAALRHAPDADAAPPPALREAILRAARTAAPPRTGWAARLEAAWAALARPPVAAAFASLFLASVVVLMWREPPPEAVDPIARDQAVAQAPAAAPPPPSPEAAPTERRTPAASPAPGAIAEAARGAMPAPARIAPPVAAPAPSPAPAPAPAQAAPATEAATPTPLAADTTGAATARDAAIGATEAPRRSAERERAASRAEEPQALAKAAPAPLEPAALWSSLAADAARWAVRRADGGAARPVPGDAVFATLAARTEWQAVPGPVTPSADDRLLERDGRPMARLGFGADGIVVTPLGGTPRALPLDATTLARLRAALGS